MELDAYPVSAVFLDHTFFNSRPTILKNGCSGGSSVFGSAVASVCCSSTRADFYFSIFGGDCPGVPFIFARHRAATSGLPRRS